MFAVLHVLIAFVIFNLPLICEYGLGVTIFQYDGLIGENEKLRGELADNQVNSFTLFFYHNLLR